MSNTLSSSDLRHFELLELYFTGDQDRVLDVLESYGTQSREELQAGIEKLFAPQIHDAKRPKLRLVK